MTGGHDFGLDGYRCIRCGCNVNNAPDQPCRPAHVHAWDEGGHCTEDGCDATRPVVPICTAPTAGPHHWRRSVDGPEVRSACVRCGILRIVVNGHLQRVAYPKPPEPDAVLDLDLVMACGCRPSGVRTHDGVPICVTHLCTEPADPQPDLTGRVAACAYNCGATRPSSPALPFFEVRTDRDQDSFYCGCKGWD